MKTQSNFFIFPFSVTAETALKKIGVKLTVPIFINTEPDTLKSNIILRFERLKWTVFLKETNFYPTITRRMKMKRHVMSGMKTDMFRRMSVGWVVFNPYATCNVQYYKHQLQLFSAHICIAYTETSIYSTAILSQICWYSWFVETDVQSFWWMFAVYLV